MAKHEEIDPRVLRKIDRESIDRPLTDREMALIINDQNPSNHVCKFCPNCGHQKPKATDAPVMSQFECEACGLEFGFGFWQEK